MPTYLLHGFRWPRPLIRIHVILQNLDDVAAEWLVAPNTTLALLRNLNNLYPDVMEHLSRLRFIEQYDPEDTSSTGGNQPYAYVADMVEEVKLGVAVDDIVSKGISNEQWGALLELRDKLAPEEKVSWFVVVCGDEERWAPPVMSGAHQQSGSLSSDLGRESGTDTEPSSDNGNPPMPPAGEPRGFKKFFGSGRLGRRKRYVR